MIGVGRGKAEYSTVFVWSAEFIDVIDFLPFDRERTATEEWHGDRMGSVVLGLTMSNKDVKVAYIIEALVSFREWFPIETLSVSNTLLHENRPRTLLRTRKSSRAID